LLAQIDKGKLLHSVKYHEEGKAAKAIFYNFEEHYYYSVFLNPYSGQVLKVRDNEAGFFHFILDGHFTYGYHPKSGSRLWPPQRLFLWSSLFRA